MGQMFVDCRVYIVQLIMVGGLCGKGILWDSKMQICYFHPNALIKYRYRMV